MFTKNIPTFTIDLDEDEYERWDEVIDADTPIVEALIEEAEEAFEDIPAIIVRSASALIGIGYKASGGYYQRELQAWADALERPFGDVVLMNCSYELSHIDVGLESIFGCTAGILERPNRFIHVRSLDWPLRNIGKATRLFKYRSGSRSFLAVGVSGFMGVLSGMLPGAYSVTINWAPPNGVPTFDFEPAFLLRNVFETCDSYEEAVYSLKHTPLSTPVFFTVCGTQRKEACVIERVQDDAAVRKLKGNVLVQANHHVAAKFRDNNDADEELLECSEERAETLERALTNSRARSLEGVAECLDRGLVCNEDSFQQMAFCPKTGEVRVWRWI